MSNILITSAGRRVELVNSFKTPVIYDKKNIHSQNIDKINKEYLPKFFINNLSDIYTC